jgi:glycosyltransferase involved in cell wall biosynthesis
MLGRGALEIKKRKKEVFIGLARLIKLYGGIYWHATNEQEKKEIQQSFGKQNEVIIADNISTNPNIAFNDLEKLKESDFELKRFLFVSRIDRKKNVEKLVHWFIAASNRFKNVKLDIIGSVEDQSYYNELLSLIVNTHNITINGAIHPNKLKEIYAKAHFFCLPTRHENYGHVIIEALSYGCPVIISQRTPWRNLQEYNVGWDLPLDKPEQFISVMEECLEMDLEHYLNMSESAYKFAQEHINREDITDAYRKLLS